MAVSIVGDKNPLNQRVGLFPCNPKKACFAHNVHGEANNIQMFLLLMVRSGNSILDVFHQCFMILNDCI